MRYEQCNCCRYLYRLCSESTRPTAGDVASTWSARLPVTQPPRCVCGGDPGRRGDPAAHLSQLAPRRVSLASRSVSVAESCLCTVEATSSRRARRPHAALYKCIFSKYSSVHFMGCRCVECSGRPGGSSAVKWLHRPSAPHRRPRLSCVSSAQSRYRRRQTACTGSTPTDRLPDERRLSPGRGGLPPGRGDCPLAGRRLSPDWAETVPWSGRDCPLAGGTVPWPGGLSPGRGDCPWPGGDYPWPGGLSPGRGTVSWPGGDSPGPANTVSFHG